MLLSKAGVTFLWLLPSFTALDYSLRWSRTCSDKTTRLNASGARTSAPDYPGRHGASLPCSVPQKYQLDEGVCEMLQSALGYAGDPQPVV